MKVNTQHALAAALTLGLLLALTAACGSAPTPTASPASTAPAVTPTAAPTPTTAPTPTGTSVAAGNLTVYSGRSESLVGPIIKQFGDVSGVKVSVKYAGTAQLAATLLEEGRNSPADMFFAQDPGGLGAVRALLQPLDASILNTLPAWARDAEGRWVGVSGRARVLVYNTARVKEAELPGDIYGLVDALWKGRLGWAPTNASLQTMVTGMRAVWGEQKTRTWLEGLKANGIKEFPNNPSQVEAVGKGEIDVALVNHYYIYPFLAERGETFAARNYHPRDGGPGALVMVAGAGVLGTAKNKAAAERFIAFMLSPVGQQYFASQTYEYPLISGITTARGVKPLAEINQPAIGVQQLSDLAGSQRLLRAVGLLP